MFARVITARTSEKGFDDVIRMAKQELPGARERPGFAGYSLLLDESSGNVIIISLWQTREDMEQVAQGTAEGVHGNVESKTGLRSIKLATYEVAVKG